MVELLRACGANSEATNRLGYTPVAGSKFGGGAAGISWSSLSAFMPGLSSPSYSYNNRTLIDLLVRQGAVEPARPPTVNTGPGGLCQTFHAGGRFRCQSNSRRERGYFAGRSKRSVVRVLSRSLRISRDLTSQRPLTFWNFFGSNTFTGCLPCA